jgi:hypothetical protein
LVTFADRLERLARLLPGVAGYQDRETSRNTDKIVRQRLSSELDEVKRQIEKAKDRCVRGKDLTSLDGLDRLTARLESLAHTVTYARYGYRGLFDAQRPDHEALAQLYAFDLGLFDDIEVLRTEAAQLVAAYGDADGFEKAMAAMELLLDRFEKTFASREAVFMEK